MNRTPRLSKSAIEYLDYVWNFASGCTKDCAYCWARKITCRFAGRYPNGFEPTVYPEAFLSPLHLKKPSIGGHAWPSEVVLEKDRGTGLVGGIDDTPYPSNFGHDFRSRLRTDNDPVDARRRP